MTPRVPILMYHSLDDSGSPISIAPAIFRRQMEVLRDSGFTGIPLSRLIDGWDGRAPLPPRPVVITFDDAFENLMRSAVGVLTEFQFSATLFAVSGYCGGRNDWPTQPAGVPRMPLLSMSQLHELAELGYEIGAHTVTHPPLGRTSTEQAKAEMHDSKRAIEDGVGRPVTTFAYPYGVASPQARAAAGELFRASCSTALGQSRREDDRQWLPRLEMFYYRTPQLLSHLGTAPGNAYIAARALARGVRGMFQSSPQLIKSDPS